MAESAYQAHQAQKRFAQVRELANKFVFDFEAAIRNTPGTVEARRMVASTARQYLADLASDTGNDPALQRELAESYYRLSQIEAAAREPGPWLDHLTEAAAILRSLHDDSSGTPVQRALYVNVLLRIASYWNDRSAQKGVPYSTEALRVAKAFYANSPQDPLAAKALMNANLAVGLNQSYLYKLSDAQQSFQEGLRWADSLSQRLLTDTEVPHQRALIADQLALVTNQLGDNLRARQIESEAIAVFDQCIATHPENALWRSQRTMMGTAANSMLRTAAAKDPTLKPKVIPAYRAVYLMAKEEVHRDPGDRDALDDEVVVTNRYANQVQAAGHFQEALQLYRESEAVISRVTERDPNDHRALYLRADNWNSQCSALADMNRWKEMVPLLAKTQALLEQILTRWPGDVVSWDLQVTVSANQCHAQRRLGNLQAARQQLLAAFQAAQTLLALNKEEKQPVSDIDLLRKEARILKVPDSLSLALASR